LRRGTQNVLAGARVKISNPGNPSHAALYSFSGPGVGTGYTNLDFSLLSFDAQGNLPGGLPVSGWGLAPHLTRHRTEGRNRADSRARLGSA
jgi:hypothetical protein